MSDSKVTAFNKTPSPKYPNGSERFRWTVETFYRAIATGVIDEPNRWELINGDLWRRDDLNPPHSFTARKVSRLMRRLFEPDSLVLEEHPIHLSTDGEPVPDICVVLEQGDEYLTRHPTQIGRAHV